ncbi:hypothetical protein EYC98_12065 [Halieaceae bacterium IMCC14734]|uniref:Uncharacterized protein n=1 Tax=Candidatus Litorirhabdus singularis TaxID=2518993 RepID=A0ABT3TH01_9GAMM|nr:PepSY-associated TM helix domain-containing protein [Candidatus Litorirhabdus singularis]MCX2981598.1 hypothetical protein [Candidatus Litorirhabdus singularis]
MDRKLLITLHLYLSAFFAPAVILVALSGGLYLLGIKGTVAVEPVYSGPAVAFAIDANSPTLKQDVKVLLSTAGVNDFEFDYVKVKGNTLYTRPTSAEHYQFKLSADAVEVIHAIPSLQNRMIELHKGHGPTAFKTFQKAFAVGLLLVILSGLWLGISAARLRPKTLLSTGAGTLLFVLLLL